MSRAAAVALLSLLLAGGALALTAGPFTADGLRAALGDARFHNEAGYALGQQGDWGGAQRAFARALEIDPSYASARRNLAIASFQLGAYEDAAREYRTLLSADPGNREYRFDLAQSLVMYARFLETDGNAAVAQLEEALDLLDSVEGYPHARENAAIIRDALAGA